MWGQSGWILAAVHKTSKKKKQQQQQEQGQYPAILAEQALRLYGFTFKLKLQKQNMKLFFSDIFPLQLAGVRSIFRAFLD